MSHGSYKYLPGPPLMCGNKKHKDVCRNSCKLGNWGITISLDTCSSMPRESSGSTRLHTSKCCHQALCFCHVPLKTLTLDNGTNLPILLHEYMSTRKLQIIFLLSYSRAINPPALRGRLTHSWSVSCLHAYKC